MISGVNRFALKTPKIVKYEYKTIIFLVALCGGETWALSLREEHQLLSVKHKTTREICRCTKDKIVRKNLFKCSTDEVNTKRGILWEKFLSIHRKTGEQEILVM